MYTAKDPTTGMCMNLKCTIVGGHANACIPPP
jgi:hypothetical protein